MRWVLGVVVAFAVLAGCGGSDESSSGSRAPMGTFVGRLEGTKAYVAVVAGKENVVAYVCDGEGGVGQLFGGSRSGNRFTAETDGARIEVDLATGGASGRVVLADGTAGDFSTEPARGEAGFYRHVTEDDGEEARVGWVVLEDGSQRGALSRVGTVSSAPALQTSTARFSLGGSTLTAVRVSPGGVDATGLMGLSGGQFG